jgi:hypothetical protein
VGIVQQNRRLSVLARLGLVWALLTAVIGVMPVQATVLAPSGNLTDANKIPITAPCVASGQPQAALAQLPLYFVKNRGQTDARVAYYVQQGDANFYFTASEVVMALPETVLRLQFVGANPAVRIEGRQEQAARFNYFIGDDPERWQRGIPTYGEIAYHDLYPGVDLIYAGRAGKLKYAFVLRPGAKPSAIRLAYQGMDELRLAESGDLLINPVGTYSSPLLRDAAPYVYQEIGGRRVRVSAAFEPYGSSGPFPDTLGSGTTYTYGFALGDYDSRYPLVIDPDLIYSTFLGGTNREDGYSIAVDDAGHIYVTGRTLSANFPTTSGAYDTAIGSSTEWDVFVSVLDPGGRGTSDLLYSTYLGGAGYEYGFGIAVDGLGRAYVTGQANSTFPTTPGAYDETDNPLDDVFMSVLAPAGDGAGDLLYSTYLGGTGREHGYDIAVDGSGYAYLTGAVASVNFPTTPNAYDTGSPGNYWDAFFSVLNPAGGGTSDLLYSTYLGGSMHDQAYSIALDGAGHAYLTGYARSDNFPTTSGAYQESHSGGDYDVFVSVLDPVGGGTGDLLYSTYLGGTGVDQGDGIAVDNSGHAYVTGYTTSSNFPITSGAYDETYADKYDVFVSVLDPAGDGTSDLLYSTFLGGIEQDYGTGIAVDDVGRAYVTGRTLSTTFPTTSGAYDENHNGDYDVFVSTLDPAGGGTSDLLYSTFLGASSTDYGYDLTVDGSGRIYVSGLTSSSNFPTTIGAYDTSYDNGFDAFVSVFGLPTGTGPGGVGTNNGRSNLELWLEADAGVTTASGSVSAWADQSGNGHDAAQVTAGYQPSHVSGQLNGQPVVCFDATDDRLVSGLTLDPAAGDLTVLAVARADTVNDGQILEQKDGTGTGRAILGYVSSSQRMGSAIGGSDSESASTYATGTPEVYGLELEGTTLAFYRNGSGDGSATRTAEAADGQWLVGSNQDEDGSFLDGDVAEIIVYGEALNNARRILVENYLQAKYNDSTVDDVTISNDRYAGDTAANGDYDLNVAGIGREIDGDNGEAHSAGMILKDAGFLQDDGDYLIMGHKVASNTWTSSDCPSGVSQRWAREWYLHRTDVNNNGGNVTVAFDFGESGLGSTPAGDYTLLKRDIAGSGMFYSIATSATFREDQIVFAGIDVSLLGSGFTLGRGGPTAVELVYFTAAAEGGSNNIGLEWQTASEIDALGFHLYRADHLYGERLRLTDSLIPSQMSGSPIGAHYEFVDQTSSPGIAYYYWLEVVDTYGLSSYRGPVNAIAGYFRLYLPLLCSSTTQG